MKYLLPTLALVLLPGLSFAQIKSSTSATSNTGGNTSDGGSVTTGDASASVHVTTQGGGQGSTVQVKTEVNGQVHEETYQAKDSIDVSVKATPTQTEVKVQKDNEPAVTTMATTSATVGDSGAGFVEIAVEPNPSLITRIGDWFSTLFSFFF